MQYVSTTATATSVEYVIDMVFLDNKSELAAGHLVVCSRPRSSCHETGRFGRWAAMKRVVTVGGLSRASCVVKRS
jgi:hypothetical protein